MTDDQAGSAVPDLDALERAAAFVRSENYQVDGWALSDDVLALVAHARTLRADNARLRAALEELVWVTNRSGDTFCDYCGEPKESPSPGMTSLGPCRSCAPLRALAGDAPAATTTTEGA